jgi:hypothetical protein
MAAAAASTARLKFGGVLLERGDLVLQLGDALGAGQTDAPVAGIYRNACAMGHGEALCLDHPAVPLGTRIYVFCAGPRGSQTIGPGDPSATAVNGSATARPRPPSLRAPVAAPENSQKNSGEVVDPAVSRSTQG